ncbi:MAG: isochorismatase family protein [Oligoflexia bacterium]|nr:isochorismatase family protein [Oligoflexia bacterium]
MKLISNEQLAKWEKLNIENALFVLIDFQKSFSSLMKKEIYENARTNILMLMRMFKKMNIPMIGTEHYKKGLGPTDELLLSEWGNYPMFEKITFSCCGLDLFENSLEHEQHKSKSLMILAGLETHICVLQTALDLLRRNYHVVVLKDAVLSSSKLKWQSGLDMMESAGAHIINTEALLFYLLKRADTPEFKYLVKLLKDNKMAATAATKDN